MKRRAAFVRNLQNHARDRWFLRFYRDGDEVDLLITKITQVIRAYRRSHGRIIVDIDDDTVRWCQLIQQQSRVRFVYLVALLDGRKVYPVYDTYNKVIRTFLTQEIVTTERFHAKAVATTI